jgi:transcription initiation factor TFIIIB Brf1 subunit/transcription initiation factor TFIIB
MKIERTNLMPENTPNSIAAGVVYFISQLCKLNVSKHDIRIVSEISEVTINKCFKKMETMTSNLIPAVIINKYS